MHWFVEKILFIHIKTEVNISMVGSGERKRQFITGLWSFMDSSLHIHGYILCCKRY